MTEMRYAIINVSGATSRIELRRSDVPFTSPFDWQDSAVIEQAELDHLFLRATIRDRQLRGSVRPDE